MAHRTFFSFNYDEDVWRASNVRQSGALLAGDVEFIDASLWEAAKPDDAAIKELIDAALARATVTAVLIGTNTSKRKWVRYEINESIRLRKGLFGVYIHRIRVPNQPSASQGRNPLSAGYKVYRWNRENGAANLGKWVDAAYDAARR